MAEIHKITKNGQTILPATTTDAVVHPELQTPLTSLINEYNVSVLFPTSGIDGTNKYDLQTAINLLDEKLAPEQKTVGIKVAFYTNDLNILGTTYTYIGDTFTDINNWKGNNDLNTKLFIKTFGIRGWTGRNNTNHFQDYNFCRFIILLDKESDLYFKGAETSNKYFYYLIFIDSNGNYMSEGARTQTGNTEDTVLSSDYPENAVYAQITYNYHSLSRSNTPPLIINGENTNILPNNQLDVIRFKGILAKDIGDNLANVNDKFLKIDEKCFRHYGWHGKTGSTIMDDSNYYRYIILLDKTSDLYFKGAVTSNKYVNYLQFIDAYGNYMPDGARTQTDNTEDTILSSEYPENAVYAEIVFTTGTPSESIEIRNGVITHGGHGQKNLTRFVSPALFQEILLQKNNIPIQAEIVIPNEINAVVGDTLQIFFDSIINSNSKDIEITFLGEKGKYYNRYWEYTPTSNDVGRSTITIIVSCPRYIGNSDTNVDNSPNIISSKKITINTINKPSSPSTEKNILCVGDSTIVSGIFVKELARRIIANDGSPLGLGIKNVNFKGRLQKSLDGGEIVGYEGNSGWSWGTYISASFKVIRFYVSGVNSLNFEAVYKDANGCQYNISEINVTEGSGNIRCAYTMGSATTTPPGSGTLTKVSGSGDNTISYSQIEEESYSPFFNNGSVDFTQYVNQYCNGKIDVMVISLGTNSIIGQNNDFSSIKDSIKTQIKTFIDKFHLQYPLAKVILCTLQKGSMNGGFGYNFGSAYNANSYIYQRKVYGLNKLYMEIAYEAGYKDFVSICDVSAEFDTIHLFPTIEKNVNNRSTIKETIGTNFGHPTIEGYLTMADSMFRTLCSLLYSYIAHI